jgi:thiol:disulfide interchange protein
MTVGLIIIYALEHSSLVSRSRSTTDPAVDLAAGAIALAAGLLLARRADPKPDRAGGAGVAAKPPGRIDRMLSRGAALAFLAGVVLNIVPGVLPFVALKDIAELDYSVPATVLILLGFYVIMFAFIEVPLVAYLVAPARTAIETARFNAWLDRNWRRLGAYALVVLGVYLLVRGAVALIAN